MSYLPSGIAFGAFATALKIPVVITIILSLFIYSGAVQSAFLGFWVTGFEPFSMILTAFLLNLRHTFYGPHIESERNDIKLSNVLAIGPLLTDEVYALSVSPLSPDKKNVLSLAIFAYANWAAATTTGAFVAGIAPTRVLDILLIALPTLFLGLLVPRVKSNYAVVTAISAGIIAVSGRLLHLPAFFIIIPILGGVIIGYAWKRYEEANKL